jgi:hypothetical protein
MRRTAFFLAAVLTSLGLATGCASSGHHHHHHYGSATIQGAEPTIGEIPKTGPTYGQLEGEVEGTQTW